MAIGTGSQAGTTVHAEMRLPPGQRAQPSDFAQSGYTAQQLSATANMSDIDSRADSGTMANAVPVTAALSQGPWTAVQGSVHNLMAQIDVLYIATGAIYGSGTVSATKAGSVAVPSGIFSLRRSIAPNKAGPAPTSAATMIILLVGLQPSRRCSLWLVSMCFRLYRTRSSKPSRRSRLYSAGLGVAMKQLTLATAGFDRYSKMTRRGGSRSRHSTIH
jgi:hypothetical protein